MSVLGAVVGTPEIVIIAVVILVLFGSAKLPKLARSLGQASTEFKKGVKDGAAEDDEAAAEPPKT
jgi:sec-independent protein translocase protein TatA